MTTKIENKTKREERKKARNAFGLLLKRLRKMCDLINDVSDWQEIVSDVENLLNTYMDSIPAEKQRRIREAMALPDATMQGLNQACRVLQLEVEGLIKYLKPFPAAATVLTIGVIVVATAVFVAAVASNLLSVEIIIRNEGCGNIRVTDAIEDNIGTSLVNNLLFDPLGIKLPEEIRNNGFAEMTMPALSIHVDNETEPKVLSIDILGIPIPFPADRASAILFDGDSIIGVQQDIDLGERDSHELILRCEE